MRMILAAMLAMTVAGCAMFEKAHNAYDAWNAGSVATNVVVASGGNATSPQGANIDLSLPLCDPDPAKYTESYMSAHANAEECGIEAQRKIVCRFCVYRPSVDGYWMISSLGINRVRKEADGLACDDFIQDGYGYHVVGGCRGEPRPNGKPTVDVAGNKELPKYIWVECRRMP